jgi:brefeldin A-inhibited guanine nucleotide-exchange protein
LIPSANLKISSDQLNINIMHAFVDMLDFQGAPFVKALRNFLQAFRLPGEAQKIDRFMLKFAERYIEGNPQTVFANAGQLFSMLGVSRETHTDADAAYVLAYAIILLNTDAHNAQIKPQNKMSKQSFFRTTAGINDGQNLPEDFLSDIYDDIVNNEIRMKDEIDIAPAAAAPAGIAGAIASVGRDYQREAYVALSHGMANKTEVGDVSFEL